MYPARLFLVCGLPGAGKTTRSTVLAERFRAVRMCADDWMQDQGIDIWDEGARASIESIQRGLSVELLRLGTNVVIEWGLWSVAERTSMRHAAESVGAIAHLEHLDVPVHVLWERVRTSQQVVGSRRIERRDLDGWVAVFERPTPAEVATFTPMPPVRATDATPSPAFPY